MADPPHAAVVGHGVDLIEVGRIAEMRRKHGQRFLDRCFTKHEQGTCLGTRRADERFAARFAAKEACAKALGTGIARGITWTDIEVVGTPEGAPELRLHGQAASIAAAQGIAAWRVSLSHTSVHAIASVIALGG